MASGHSGTDRDGMRDGETAVSLPDHFDAGLYFIGRIRSPWPSRAECPRRGDAEAGPICTLELDPRWSDALTGLGEWAQVLYWMDEARRDLVMQVSRGGTATGTFTLRSPVRPNPIAVSLVRVVAVEGTRIKVRGLDCRDGTPLLDIKKPAAS